MTNRRSKITDFSASVEVGRVCKMAVEQRVELSRDVVESCPRCRPWQGWCFAGSGWCGL